MHHPTPSHVRPSFRWLRPRKVEAAEDMSPADAVERPVTLQTELNGFAAFVCGQNFKPWSGKAQEPTPWTQSLPRPR